MNKKVNQKLVQVAKLLSNSKNITIYKDERLKILSKDKLLLEISKNQVTGIFKNLINKLNRKSRLSDAFCNLNYLVNFLKYLDLHKHLLGFGHLGFCYQVKSPQQEKQQLKQDCSLAQIHLYQIPSTTPELWLFAGKTNELPYPMVEFLPIDKGVKDYYLDYWLPHIHFDIDTNLPPEKIKYLVHSLFKGSRTANPSVVYPEGIYQQRVWLGVIEGVNIDLDLSTNLTKNKTERRTCMKKLI